MGWTKRQLVTQAFEDAGMASYVFDLTPEDLDSARRKLDAMMANWVAKGLNIGYAAAIDADGSDLDQDAGVPAVAVLAITSNLAKLIAASYGKAVPPTTTEAARDGLDSLMNLRVQTPEIPYSGLMPRGAGNRRYAGIYNPFFPPPNTSPVGNAPNGDLTLGE